MSRRLQVNATFMLQIDLGTMTDFNSECLQFKSFRTNSKLAASEPMLRTAKTSPLSFLEFLPVLWCAKTISQIAL